MTKKRKTHLFFLCKGNGTCDPTAPHCGECARPEADPVHHKVVTS